MKIKPIHLYCLYCFLFLGGMFASQLFERGEIQHGLMWGCSFLGALGWLITGIRQDRK